MYTQLAFALQRVKNLAPEHPEWQEQQPFKAALAGDMAALGQAGAEGMVQILMATHSGITSDEFKRITSDWLATARHPRFQRPYTELVYRPMLELLVYLRANGFKTFIVSGGGVDEARSTLDTGEQAVSVLDDCKARKHLTQAAACSQSLLDMLYELSGYTVGWQVAEALKVHQEKYLGALKKACTMPE